MLFAILKVNKSELVKTKLAEEVQEEKNKLLMELSTLYANGMINKVKMKNLIIIGTSHIAKESLDEIKLAIEKEKPEIICLELDRQRLSALMSPKKAKINFASIFKVGFKGFLFSLLGAWAEKKLGDYVGMSPGSEMKLAVKLAEKNKIRIALIDQNIEITLQKLSKTITWREKWNFIVDVFKSIFLRKKDPDFNFDLRTVPAKKLIEKIIDNVRKRYPNIYNVLIKERNEIMAKRLARLIKEEPNTKILAIVGAGHKDKILNIIQDKHLNKSVF